MPRRGKTNYSLEAPTAGRMPAPKLPYKPRDPRRYRPNIALIACGGITKHHLAAYRKAGYPVVALCDVAVQRAKDRQAEFFPQAKVYRDWRDVLRRDDIEVVDLAAHPLARAPMIQAALEAGKHVLSQKPFVLDLDFGRRMADLADKKGVKLAVNQNGRWAPHFSYLRQAIRAGLVGEVSAAHSAVHWDHSWVKGTPFAKIRHLILYDFAIHWFDILSCFLDGRRPERVYASMARTPWQPIEPPLLAQALIEYDGAQASLVFDAHTQFGPQDRTYVTGSKGTLASIGPNSKRQKVTLTTAEGWASPRLQGRWFSDGFHGTMGELLNSIEENREPENGARENLESLALCFAAVASAERHRPIVPGSVRKMPSGQSGFRRSEKPV